MRSARYNHWRHNGTLRWRARELIAREEASWGREGV